MFYYIFSLHQCRDLTAPFLGQVRHVQESYVVNPGLNINFPGGGFSAPEGSAALRLGFILFFLIQFHAPSHELTFQLQR